MKYLTLVLITVLGLGPLLVGCDDNGSTVEHQHETQVKDNGTTVDKDKTVKQKSDGTVVKQEKTDVNKP